MFKKLNRYAWKIQGFKISNETSMTKFLPHTINIITMGVPFYTIKNKQS